MPENNGFEHTPKSCWEVFTGDEHEKAIRDAAERYIEFLSTCKTERETVDYAVECALALGFGEDFAGDKIMRTMRGKTVLLARKGKRPLSEGFRMIGAHGDTPRLDFKQHPLYEEAAVGLAKTHYYGGIKKYHYLARPLAIHGTVIKQSGETVKIVLGEDPSEPCFSVLDLLPHLAQDQREKPVSKAFEAEKLNVVLGHRPEIAEKKDDEDENKPADLKIKPRLLKLLNEKYGIVEEDLYSAEIQVVPAGPARFVGLDASLIGGYAHDDRACCFIGLEAFFAQDEQPEHTQIVILWDKEETGSDGATGAKSKFFEYCLQDMIAAWEPGASFGKVCMAGKAISADVHGALDPDYPEVHEKLNASKIGYGPVLCKYTGHGGKYGANDADAEYVGFLRRILNEAGIPWQMAMLGKVDLGGGGTVAKHLAEYGMDIIDSGPSVLAMHSPFEIMSTVDLYATIKAYGVFLRS